MRLIDADALYNEILSLQITLGGKDIFTEPAKRSVLESIDNQETFDYKPVKRGKWLIIQTPFNEIDALKCSECGVAFEPKLMTYCPNCGALMP